MTEGERTKEAAVILKKIIDYAIRDLDLLACYQHYLVFDEIKLFWKKENDMPNL